MFSNLLVFLRTCTLTSFLSSVAYGRCIYIFGGYNSIEQQHYGDILKFDTGNENHCYYQPDLVDCLNESILP